MREIPKKNYLVLVVLLFFTLLITLSLSNVYLNKEKLVSDFYEYSNKITVEEFEQFMTENSDVIIYISDKYDLTHETFEKELQKTIDDLNLKQNLIFLDKTQITKEFISKFKKLYNINIDLEKTPVVIVIIEEEVVKNISVTHDSNISSIIDYEVFK